MDTGKFEVNKIYEGKALEVIKTFPDKCINSVITSPAYWQLRDYGWDGHGDWNPLFRCILKTFGV